MNIASKKSQRLAPKPVHPTNIRTHGLLGITNLRQHMIMDERWTASSITEEYKGLTDLLNKRYAFQKLEIGAHRKRCSQEFRSLRHQCRDGRTKLQMTLHGENAMKIRYYLIDHKDMQRLYQTMPIHKVVHSMNQRSFVMRKEKDRLLYRLEQLKKTYEKNLIERSRLENRLKYQNEYILEEEYKSREFRKLIENSTVRFKAIRNINITYEKLIQILRHDSIFYEPILRSLSNDIDDQANFVKHILFIGMPAIAKFKHLGDEYRLMDERSRKNMQDRAAYIHTSRQKKKIETTRRSIIAKTKEVEAPAPAPTQDKRYARETKSMTYLKNKLEATSSTIKLIEFGTLCSNPNEIFSRIKSQVENNIKLHRTIAEEMLSRVQIEAKMKRSEVLEEILINNLDVEELERTERIRALQDQIAEEGHKKAKIIAHMKDRANAYVVLRLSLWNLADILRHVDRSLKGKEVPYPASYLELPLLKFEMMNMSAVPPEPYESDVDSILHQIKRKVYKLMKAYTEEVSSEDMSDYAKDYGTVFLETAEVDDSTTSDDGDIKDKEEEQLLEARLFQTVPNRLQIKAQSAKIVEEMSKKDE